MNGWLIVLIAYLTLNALLQIALVGKPRKTRTPSEAVVGVLEMGALAFVAIMAVTTS